MNGWGPKSSIRPSKPGKSNFLGGISRDFAGISRGRPKSLRKKNLGSIFVPYHIGCSERPRKSRRVNVLTGAERREMEEVLGVPWSQQTQRAKKLAVEAAASH